MFCKNTHDESEEPGSKECVNHVNAKHFHREFYGKRRAHPNVFDCLNREDESESLFKRPVHQNRRQSPKISLVLNYTEDHFFCNEVPHNWSVEVVANFGTVSKYFRN